MSHRREPTLGLPGLRAEIQELFGYCQAQSRYNHTRQDTPRFADDVHPYERPTPLELARDRAWHLGKEEAYTRVTEKLRSIKVRYAIGEPGE